MDSFLQKFSLQNLLRQFFCGVMFFVPLWLYAHTQLGELAKVENWGIGNLFLFVSLASTIGTIIYHLEKNLYSYPLNISADKLSAFENDVFIFDCNIDGRRYCWCAPVVVISEAFEKKKLHQADKDAAPYAPYLDYKKGLIYNSPYSSDTEIVCQLSRITDGETFEKLLKSTKKSNS